MRYKDCYSCERLPAVKSISSLPSACGVMSFPGCVEACVVGCVATALEEVISFHRPLVTLQDSLAGWTTAHYTIPTVYAGASVDTRLIRDNYDTPGTYTEAELQRAQELVDEKFGTEKWTHRVP